MILDICGIVHFKDYFLIYKTKFKRKSKTIQKNFSVNFKQSLKLCVCFKTLIYCSSESRGHDQSNFYALTLLKSRAKNWMMTIE